MMVPAVNAARTRLERGRARLLRRPTRALPYLPTVAVSVELAQYVHEFFPGAHALGEVARNLAYALVGAVLFHWLVVELPSARRQHATYEFNRVSVQLLLISGPGLLWQYQHAAAVLGHELNVWDEASFKALADKVATAAPSVFGLERAGLLQSTVELGIPRALAELSRSASYLDPDVAHALSQFPLQEGLSVLQIRRTPSGGIEPSQDAHITWSLLESARRLYPVLLSTGAYGPDIFEGYVGDPPVQLKPDVLVRAADER